METEGQAFAAGERRAGWDDRLFRLSAAGSVLAATWFLGTLVLGPTGPVILGWLLPPLCAGAAAVLCRRAGTAEGANESARHFWRRAGVGLAIFSVSMVSRIADSVHADLSLTSRLSMTSAALHAAGLACLLWPLFRLPLGEQSRSRRVAFGLDIGTLMVAAAVFIWHFTAGPMLRSATAGIGATVAGVALMILGLVGVFVVAKVVLTGTASLERGSLRALGAALAVGGLGSSLTVLLVDRPYLDTSLLVVPVACFLIGLGARRQVLAATAVRHPARPARRYSLLPYAAIAASSVLLLVTIAGHSPDVLFVAVATVAMTALVVVRQLTAFRENDHLLSRLDAGHLELVRQERRYRVLVQNSSDVVSVSDPHGTITYISDAVYRLLGRDPAHMLNSDITPLVHPDDRDMMAAQTAGVCARPGATATYQARLAHADGSWRWLEIISANLLDEPSVRGIVSNARDVTETLQVQEKLSYEATHDVLTGLANRALFNERVETAVATAAPDRPFSVVLVDLDDFKTVNDTLGHSVGDGLLAHVAQRMSAIVRPSDTVARLGGDEFAILFAGAAAVEAVVARIADALLEAVHIDGHLLSVQASFGVVEGRGGDDAGELLRRADIAMYEAKERGEGGAQRYQPGMEARGAERGRLAAALRTAITENELVLHYQPVVTLPDGRISGVEALVRWQHPEQGLLGPGAFIETAEMTGLIVPLGRWVLGEATRQAAAWIVEYGERAPGSVSVNASARQLRDPRFPGEVAAALRDNRLPAHRLIIEITESSAVGGGATRDNLRALRGLGVRLSLDDFGTGASTLSLLATCPVDQIKLDRSFAPVPGPAAIAIAVVQLAKAFGLEAVAEGVETPAQAKKLETLGYARAQGFHFAKPMSPAGLAAALAATSGTSQAAA
jgi:diguanylate cyclase (GGDEF)-like protein/PAS domain S-box-containing protein